MALPIFDPRDAGQTSDPDPHLRESRARCPVASPYAGLRVVVLDADVRAVLTDADNYSNRGNFRLAEEDEQDFTLITSADGSLHTELRRRMHKNFAPRPLRKLRARVAELVDSTVAALPDRGEVDLYEHFVRHVPIAVVYALIGLPEENWALAEKYGDAIVSTVPAPAEDLPEYAQLMTLLGEAVAQRRAHPDVRREDVMDNLCFAAAGEREMSAEEVVAHLLQLVLAGTDTTRSLITNCVWRLLQDGAVAWDSVVAGRDRLPNAIEESLRYDAPVQFIMRSARTAKALRGHPVEPGDKILLSLQSANRDEATWGADADRFDPAREGVAAHLAFGRGRHNCLGAPLARIEAEVAVGALMDRFPRMRLSQDAAWVDTSGPISRRPDRMLVDLAPAPVPG
ncbi:cytochrome P450 [Amycolatopsis ultiminotia]|uniref:Cytochrome P450 n=1 Tax=Amycolatopsis ultiminotia TaxID=543629 RepID=A0ABP6V4Y3_9PSEU